MCNGYYGLLLSALEKSKQQDDWAGRGRKLFNAVGGGGRLTRSGLVDGVEGVCLRWRSRKPESWATWKCDERWTLPFNL